MISKEHFVKMVNHLKRNEQYNSKLCGLAREYEQDNVLGFDNKDFEFAFDIALRESLDNNEWMFECVWDYLLEGEIEFIGSDSTTFLADAPEKLYDFFINGDKQ